MGSEKRSDPPPTADPEDPLTQDERVKLDLEFEEALRALLGTPPPENGQGAAESEPQGDE